MPENIELLRTTLDQTQLTIQGIIEKSWGERSGDQLPEVLVNDMDQLLSTFQQLGDMAAKPIEADALLLPTYLNYVWPESVKSFLILWRDVIYQQYKARLLFVDGSVKQDAILQLEKESREIISRAANELFTEIEAAIRQLEADPKRKQRQLKQWLAQQNPYPVYRQQLSEIQAQAHYLQSKFIALESAIRHYQQIYSLFETHLIKGQSEIKSIQEKSLKMVEFIQENLLDQPDQLNEYIADKIEGTHTQYSADAFRSDLNALVSKLDSNLEAPVVLNQGWIQYRELSLQKVTRNWLDVVLLPLVYEIMEIVENTGNALKMALLNIRNQSEIKLGEDKKKEKFTPEVIRPLLTYLDRVKQYQERQDRLIARLRVQLKQEFHATKMLDTNAPFLPLPAFTTTQYNFQNTEWIKPLRSRLKNRFQFFEQFKAKVAQEGELSDAEKVVRFIQSRQMDEESLDYNSIFLARGYVGESFWVGRKSELAHIKKLITQWKENYRGAVIISGQPLSGKSLFGTLVAKQFFEDNVIRLAPNSILQVGGRRFETTYQLEEALTFIRKHSINTRRMIWIDDLELWNDSTPLFLQNVRSLCQHIDSYSRQFFFVVSMNNWLKAHLQQTLQIDRVFQAEINLDQVGIEDLRQAILTRHGATNRLMVNKQGIEINSPQFRKITKQIYKASGGNIGEALLHWAFLTKHYDEESVQLEVDYDHGLPGFISPDTAILLITVLMEKRTNEYRLLQRFGQPFKVKYKGILQRMINIGLLKRYPDGWLEVNELVVNELGRLLDRMQYLKFYHQN